ncbi:hypothetical protein AY599_03105 [Leptolyngbya valderiana BDU 20041]|nr:hypothetical protein AY599_03105 [Leptolyngbya valderiana BDU 20041]
MRYVLGFLGVLCIVMLAIVQIFSHSSTVRASDVRLPMWQPCDVYLNSRSYEACVDLVDRYGIDIGRADGTVPQPEETVTYEDFFYMLDRSLDVMVELLETLDADRP